MADDGAEDRPFSAVRAARQNVMWRMVAEVVRFDAADNSELIHDAGLQRQVLANLDARHGGGNGPELAADFRGRGRFHVVAIDVRRSAAQPDEDDRLAP